MNLRRLSELFFIRNLDAENLLEAFFVSAVASLLLIRFYLIMTNFPQIGGQNFHIAHMLWGGFFMMLAIIIFSTFLTRPAKLFAAALGGIGFGTFIDELGKFITKDNNYFYQPAVAIIYIIFVLLYILIQSIDRYTDYSPREYLINAIELLKEVVVNDLDRDEKNQVMAYLKKSDPNEPIVKDLRKLVNEIDLIPPPNPTIITQIKLFINKIYTEVVSTKVFLNSLILLILANTLASVAIDYYYYTGLFTSPRLPIPQLGIIISSLLSTFFVVLGLFELRRSRYEAYRMFRYAMLISILLTQVFAFYTIQFFALIGLTINIVLLVLLDYSIDRERKKHMKKTS